MDRIVIIGNGFDLAHGLKTSYGDFIKYIIEKSIHYDEDIRKELIDVGGMLSDEQSYETIKDRIKGQITRDEIIFKNTFFKALLSAFFVADWVDIESYYFKYLSNVQPNDIDKFNSEFEIIKKHLGLYLLQQNLDITFNPLRGFFDIFEGGKPSSLLLLNFNFTQTLERYFIGIEVKEKSIINIHGELESKENPMIFGYGDDTDQKYKDIIAKNKNEYLKNLKREQYNFANSYKAFIATLSSLTDIEVFVVGHSLGLSDKTMLNQILDYGNVSSINMYYKDREGFENLNYNLRRIVSDETYKSGKIVNFPDSIPIPQAPKR